MPDTRSRLPKALYRAAQVRELDRIAIDGCGIKGFALMHKAASVTFSVLLEKWPQARHLLVFVGTGNNGGDGYVIAGLAKDHGLNPQLLQLGNHDRLKGDALLAQQFAEQRGVSAAPFDPGYLQEETSVAVGHTVVVDAMLGTGLDRPVSGEYIDAIESINGSQLPVLAVDVPSGICSDTGNILGDAVHAQFTVTFIGLKQGLLTGRAVDVSGEIIFHNLDVPEQVYNGDNSPVPGCQRIDMNQVSRLLSPRHPSAHKGEFGHTVILGGDYGYGGAVLMAAEAAVRTGSGLVSVVTRSVNRTAMLTRRPEVMLIGTEDSGDPQERITDLLIRASVIVVGPGLGKSAWSRQLLQSALQLQRARDIPLVIDADGLNLLAERRSQSGSESSGLAKRHNWVLTPHPGEAATLLGCETRQIQQDRFAAVTRLQQEWGGACLLKGAGSLICFTGEEGRQIELCSEGNPGMASGGMGDVLSGIVGALVAQGFPLSDSLRIACCVHGESADLVAARSGQRGIAATDLYPFIQQLLNPDN